MVALAKHTRPYSDRMETNLFLLLLFIGVVQNGACVNVNIQDDTKKADLNGVTEYFTRKLSDVTDQYDRLISELRATIQHQGREIETLKSSKRTHESTVSNLQKRVESLEAQLPDNAREKQEETEKETRDIGNNFPQAQRIKRSDVENRVAFFAARTNHTQQLGQGQDIVFDHAVTNIANAYNAHHGTFIAPTSGVYVFSVTLGQYSWLNTTGAKAWIVVNGSHVATFWVEYEQASQTIVLKLTTGDDVAVQNGNKDKRFAGILYSTFSGFLLYEGLSSSPIVG